MTEQRDPMPHMTTEEQDAIRRLGEGLEDKSPIYRNYFINFIERLKKAGLTHAILAGEYLGGRGEDRFGWRYRGASRNPPLSKMSNLDWKLKDYYIAKGQLNHPFTRLSPEGCVAEMVRFLAYSGVNIDFTTTVFPSRVPRPSQVDRIQILS